MNPQPKKAKVKKLKVTKVQDAVNKAIRERDQDCVVRDGKHTCAGVLTASHFYGVGGNSVFRFYPPNIHGQCFGHHGIHERNQDPFFYADYMWENYESKMFFMRNHWSASIKYSQPVLREIYQFALKGDLDGLTDYIEQAIEGSK